MSAWKLLREVGLTALGMFCIYTQIFSAKPNGLLLGTGLALTVPSVAAHVRALLPGGTTGDPSESQPSPGQSSQPSSSGGQ